MACNLQVRKYYSLNHYYSIKCSSGWGLLSSILDTKLHRHVLLSLAYTSSHWDADTGGEFSEEKVFDTVKYVYDNMPGKELHTLVPKFGIWFEEVVSGRKEMERKKELTLFFNAKWALEVKFTIEKKRNNRSLVDLAAEAVVQNILIEEEITELPIPETLFSIVRTKFCDIEWVRSYWNSQPEIESPSKQSIESKAEEDPSTAAPLAASQPQPAQQLDPEEESLEEEFLSSVIDDFTDDVQQIIDNHVNNNGDNLQQRTSSPNGIDGLLIIWVVLFLILAVIVYSCC